MMASNQFTKNIECGDNMSNHELAYSIYEKSGQYVVFDSVNEGLLKCDRWCYCEPCETESPYEDNACLVCATPIGVEE
jgi:hypothetical protein